MQVNGAKEDTKVLFMSDTKTFFSKNYGWSAGMGDRNGRWVMVIERDGNVSVADVEENGRQVTVSLHPSRHDIFSTFIVVATARAEKIVY